MVYMLFDNPEDKQRMSFLNDYETASIRQIYPLKKCSLSREMIAICLECIKQSTNDDIIICWYDFMAVLCWWLCKIQLKKRKIIALNILLKDKNTIKNKLAKFLYKFMLKSDEVQATVNSPKYGEYLNKMLGIQKEYILLHDVYHRDECNYETEMISKSIFCGGRNGRDWDFLIEIAQAMPAVTFHCVMPKDKLKYYKERFSCNMVVKSDISEKEFLDFMRQSELVAIPLDTEAPAGLITFYQTVANRKLVIVSDTVTTQEYFANGRGVLCGKDVKEWKEKIQYYLYHEDEAKICAAKFKTFLENECSEEKYAKTLWEIIEKKR